MNCRLFILTIEKSIEKSIEINSLLEVFNLIFTVH